MKKELPKEIDLQQLPDEVIGELSGPRALHGLQNVIVFIVALSWSIFQLSLGSILILNSTIVRAIHLAFALILVFMTYPMFKKTTLGSFKAKFAPKDRFTFIEIAIGIVAVIAALYIILDYVGIAERIGMPIARDRIWGILLFVLLLEAARRVVGPALPVLAVIFTLYAFFGFLAPAVIAFKGVSIDRFLSQITMSTEGIYGVPLGVSANIVFLFVLFGTMLEKAGGGKYFIMLSTSLLGGFKGGPAKAAILSSGITGMISGSSIANVVTTGTFTIPLMKSVGYPAKKAGAIEVASSVCGQLMPPIMGAAAFIMAEYVGVPYVEIVKAAFLPAFTAYAALFYISHLEAGKLGLRGLTRDERPEFVSTFLSGLHYLIPLIILIYKLVVLRHSPEASAFMAIFFLIGVMLLQDPVKAFRAGKPVFPALWDGFQLVLGSLAAGARNMVTVAIATAAAGIIVGVVTLGLGGMVTELVDVLSRGNIILMLVITAIASLILGMGLPTTANYIVMAALTAPIIVKVGAANEFVVPLIAAHMFVFYFGILADDTPPVGLAAYAAAAIAKSDPIQTGIQGFIYDIRTAILPFMFIFNLELLMIGVYSWVHGAVLFVTAIFAACSFAAATQGWLITKTRWYEVIALLVITLIMFQPALPLKLIGVEMDYRMRSTDIQDPVQFSRYILDEETAFAQYLGKTLSNNTRHLMEQGIEQNRANDTLRIAIAAELNKKIESGKIIYQKDLFADVKLSPQTEKLLADNPVSVQRQIRLNRMLLNDAYPQFVKLSKLTELERTLGFHPKYFSFLIGFGLWGLIYLLQHLRIKRQDGLAFR